MRRKTPRQRQVERTLRAIEHAHGLPLDGEAAVTAIKAAPRGEDLMVALVTVPVDPQDDSFSIARPTYHGYADAPAGVFHPAFGGKTTNRDRIVFGGCVHGRDEIVGFAVYDMVSGEIIAHGVVPPLTIDAVQTPPIFTPGAMTVTIS